MVAAPAGEGGLLQGAASSLLLCRLAAADAVVVVSAAFVAVVESAAVVEAAAAAPEAVAQSAVAWPIPPRPSWRPRRTGCTARSSAAGTLSCSSDLLRRRRRPRCPRRTCPTCSSASGIRASFPLVVGQNRSCRSGPVLWSVPALGALPGEVGEGASGRRRADCEKAQGL